VRKFNKERLLRAIKKSGNVDLATLYTVEFGYDITFVIKNGKVEVHNG